MLKKIFSYLAFSLFPVFAFSQQNAAGVPLRHTGNEKWFYIFCAMALLLGLFRTFYARYFSTLFKVFFNTSLKQSQLTDQLQLAKLQSLLLNIFFTMSAGVFIYLTVLQNAISSEKMFFLYLVLSIAAVGIIYGCKALVLQAAGYFSGMKEQANTYVFVIFLINKILGIILIPFSILLVFSPAGYRQAVFWTAIFTIFLLFLLRYYRSYSLLQNKVKASRFHLLLFIVAVEILPLLLIYKAGLMFLDKKL